MSTTNRNQTSGFNLKFKDFDTWPNAIGQLRRYQTIFEREGQSVNKMIKLVVFNCGDQDTKDMKQVCKKFDIVARSTVLVVISCTSKFHNDVKFFVC